MYVPHWIQKHYKTDCNTLAEWWKVSLRVTLRSHPHASPDQPPSRLRISTVVIKADMSHFPALQRLWV